MSSRLFQLCRQRVLLCLLPGTALHLLPWGSARRELLRGCRLISDSVMLFETQRRHSLQIARESPKTFSRSTCWVNGWERSCDSAGQMEPRIWMVDLKARRGIFEFQQTCTMRSRPLSRSQIPAASPVRTPSVDLRGTKL